MRTITYILMAITAFLLCSCGTRKTEKSNKSNEINLSEKIKSVEFDYSKFIYNSTNYDRSVIYVREFENGNLTKETWTKNDKAETSTKVNIVKKYKYFNIYKTYKITETEKTKETKKSDNTVLYIGLFAVLMVFFYFISKRTI